MRREDIHWLDEERDEAADEGYTGRLPDEPLPPKKRKKIVLIVLIALCAACLGAFFLSDSFYRMVHHQTANTLAKTGDPIEYTPDGVTSVRPFKDLCLRINGDGVLAISRTGAPAWDVPFSMGGPSLSQRGDYAAIADLKGNQICILDTSGLVGTITTESTIAFCDINRRGDVAVILRAEDSHILVVYDRNANILVRRVTHIAEDGVPVAITIDDEASRMATSYVLGSEMELRSVLTLFNLTDPDSQAADKIAGNYSFPGTLITDLAYMDDMLLYVGDNLIGGIQTGGNTSEGWQETPSHRILSVGFGSDFLAVLYGDGMAGVSSNLEENLIVYDPSGSHTGTASVGIPDSMTVESDLVVYQEGLTYTAIRPDGSTYWFYTSDSSLQGLYALGQKAACALGSNSITMMQVSAIEETEDSNE